METKYHTVYLMGVSGGDAWNVGLEQAAGQTNRFAMSEPSRSPRVDNVVDFTAWKAAHESERKDDEDEIDFGADPVLVDGFDPYFEPDIYDDLAFDEDCEGGEDLAGTAEMRPNQQFRNQMQSPSRGLQRVLQVGEMAVTVVVLAIGLALLARIFLW